MNLNSEDEKETFKGKVRNITAQLSAELDRVKKKKEEKKWSRRMQSDIFRKIRLQLKEEEERYQLVK